MKNCWFIVLRKMTGQVEIITRAEYTGVIYDRKCQHFFRTRKAAQEHITSARARHFLEDNQEDSRNEMLTQHKANY